MKVFTVKLQPNGALLTVYTHDVSKEMQSAALRPGVLILPGGGYFMCSDREAEPIALSYLSAGYNAFVLRYTVGPSATFEQAMQDAEAAMEYIRAHADECQVESQKIAAVGFSAGGHLTACLGAMGNNRPNALILGYPAIQKQMGSALRKELPGADEHVTKDTPPTFLFSTQGDSLVPIENTLDFVGALRKNRVPFELHVFLTGEHGLSLAEPQTANGNPGMINADVAQWMPMSVRFLKNLWGDVEVNVEATPAAPAGGKALPGKERVIDLPVGKLMETAAYAGIIDRYIPGIAKIMEVQPAAQHISLRAMSDFSPDRLPKDMLAKADAELEAAKSRLDA